MPVIDNNKPPSAGVGVDNGAVTQHMTDRQTISGDFAASLRKGLVTGVQGSLSMASAVLSVNGPNVVTQAMNRASSALNAGAGGDAVSQFRGPSTLAGMGDNRPTLADAQTSPSVAVMASNNSAIVGQKPTFMSILQDSGTGGPNFGSSGSVSASMSMKSNATAATPATGNAAGISTASINTSASFTGGEGLGLGAMGVNVSGLNTSALGAGATSVPAGAGSMMTGTGAGGDSIASGAMSGGSGSQAQLFQATQGMQEMQMSFNMQYLQLQNSMQNDNRQFTMVSNIMKTKHDTVKNTISNIH